MRKKKALSANELKIEKVLQQVLPEYDIRANMRLADVLHAGEQFKYMQGYHLDFVICDREANVIAAIELDDSTHDTDDGKRRDANKNRWLAEADIRLIRIRTEEEALNIRGKIFAQEIKDEHIEWYSYVKNTSESGKPHWHLPNNEKQKWQSPKTYRRSTFSKAPAVKNHQVIQLVKGALLLIVLYWIVTGASKSIINWMQKRNSETMQQQRIEEATRNQNLKTEILTNKTSDLLSDRNRQPRVEREILFASSVPTELKPPQANLQAPTIQAEKNSMPAKPRPFFYEVYKKPIECENPQTDSMVVKCVNHYIRARNQYEANNGIH